MLYGTLNARHSDLQIFTEENIESIGVSLNDSTVSEILAAMPLNSIIFSNCEDRFAFAHELFKENGNGGAIIIYKRNEWRIVGISTNVSSNKLYIAKPSGSNEVEWLSIEAQPLS